MLVEGRLLSARLAPFGPAGHFPRFAGAECSPRYALIAKRMGRPCPREAGEVARRAEGGLLSTHSTLSLSSRPQRSEGRSAASTDPFLRVSCAWMNGSRINPCGIFRDDNRGSLCWGTRRVVEGLRPNPLPHPEPVEGSFSADAGYCARKDPLRHAASRRANLFVRDVSERGVFRDCPPGVSTRQADNRRKDRVHLSFCGLRGSWVAVGVHLTRMVAGTPR
jgi:hypothetical protein